MALSLGQGSLCEDNKDSIQGQGLLCMLKQLYLRETGNGDGLSPLGIYNLMDGFSFPGVIVALTFGGYENWEVAGHWWKGAKIFTSSHLSHPCVTDFFPKVVAALPVMTEQVLVLTLS